MKLRLLMILALVFVFSALSQTDFKGVYRNDNIAYQLTIRYSTFENGTCGYPGYDSSWFQSCHSERGTYYVIDSVVDTLRGAMLTMDGMPAVQPNYCWITKSGDSLYAYFYDKTNGPYIYHKIGSISLPTIVFPLMR